MSKSMSTTPRPPDSPLPSPSDSRAWAATPASWAMYASRGRWKYFAHLHKLNEKLLDLTTGKLRKLVVTFPPRWGKSELCSRYLPGWFMGVKHGARVIIASHTESLSAAWALKCRNDFAEFGQDLFGASVSSDLARQGEWSTTKGSSIYAVGVGGAVVGRGADLLVVDDPIAGMEEAESESGRVKLLDWLYSEALSRLQEHGVALLIGTRWRVNDIIGSVMESGGWEHLLLPALGEDGQSTAPGLFSTGELLTRKAQLPPHIWEGMYQGSPFVRGGGIFPMDRIGHLQERPVNPMVVRAWDLAASTHGDYTGGLLLGRIADGSYVVLDLERFRLPPGERDERIKATAVRDGRYVPVLFEQEPGSAGLVQFEALRKFLVGYRVMGERPVGSKEMRAGPVASIAWAGLLKVLDGQGWTKDFLGELEAFPSGAHDDSVDALTLGYNWLSQRTLYVPPPSGVHHRSRYTPEQLMLMGIHPGEFPEDSKPRSPMDAFRCPSPFPRRGGWRFGP